MPTPDIVQRLRGRYVFMTQNRVHWYELAAHDKDCTEAADEIDRLRAEVERLRGTMFDDWQANPYTKVLQQSIERDYVPRADVERLKSAQPAAQAPADDAVPWPTVARYSGGAHGRVWLVLDDSGQEVEYVRASTPPTIPPGYALVPVEPTQAMCQAGQWKAQEWPKFPLRISPIWKAMLAAAIGEQSEPKGARDANT